MSAEKTAELKKYLENKPGIISPLVDFNKVTDRLYPFDFTSQNTLLHPDTIADTGKFSQWVDSILEQNGCRYGIGGYDEHRILYSRSTLFDDEEPRRLHLGTDIWGPAGTQVFSPLEARVHSTGFNDNFGDYGATIILEHDLGGLPVHTLYGHLNLESIQNLKNGQEITRGQQIAAFGIPAENGQWPPHLHFQLIFDMGGRLGDYPGVCRFSERLSYLDNCPDPATILNRTFQ